MQQANYSYNYNHNYNQTSLMQRVNTLVSQFSHQHSLLAKNLKEVYSTLVQVLGILETIIEDQEEMVELKGFFKKYTQPDQLQKQVIQQVVLEVFIDKVARQKTYLDERGTKKYFYECQEVTHPVYIHPTSVLYKKHPEWLTYTHLLHTGRHNLINASQIKDLSLLFQHDHKTNVNILLFILLLFIFILLLFILLLFILLLFIFILENQPTSPVLERSSSLLLFIQRQNNCVLHCFIWH